MGGQSLVRAAEENNINQRYLVESVSLAGIAAANIGDKALPFTLRSKLVALIGQRCDTASLEDLASQIRSQLHLRDVSQHLSRGKAPDTVNVDFQLTEPDLTFDLSLPRFLYHSQQHFSGELDATTRFRGNSVIFGVVSNGDDLTERFSGMKARFDSAPIGNGRLRFHADVEDFHQQWATQTLVAAGPADPEIYRSRWNIVPSVSIAASGTVTVSAGMSFAQTDNGMERTGDRIINAATFGAAFNRKIEGSRIRQQLEGKYDLRLVSRVLGSTYAYARHLMSFKYELKAGRHRVAESFTGGSIAGSAPMFDHFVLGTSSNLRGWNRYELDPLGGSRIVHNEISYSVRSGDKSMEGFYDAGALWQMESRAKLRHSAGVSYRQGVFVFTMAFPLRAGRVEPVFMAGMNY